MRQINADTDTVITYMTQKIGGGDDYFQSVVVKGVMEAIIGACVSCVGRRGDACWGRVCVCSFPYLGLFMSTLLSCPFTCAHALCAPLPSIHVVRRPNRPLPPQGQRRHSHLRRLAHAAGGAGACLTFVCVYMRIRWAHRMCTCICEHLCGAHKCLLRPCIHVYANINACLARVLTYMPFPPTLYLRTVWPQRAALHDGALLGLISFAPTTSSSTTTPTTMIERDEMM